MQSFLITGSDEKGRLQEVEKVIGKKLSSLKNNPDFIILQLGEGSSIGIAEVRFLQERLSLKPFQEKEKIALIKEAQNLTSEAQNALLKTLEEPNATSLLILTAPSAYWLLPTVVSRCQIIQQPSKSRVIEEHEFQKIVDLWSKLLTSPLSKRFKVIEEEGTTKDRETAVLWLDKLTFVIRQLLLSSYQIPASSADGPARRMTSKYLNILFTINKYKKFLEANCNVKLTVEVFLTKLP